MSLISLSGMGIRRDQASSPPVGGFGELVVAQIPSEVLLAYATLLAIFSVGGSDYKPGRWILYGAAVLVCPLIVVTTYLARRDYLFIDPQTKTTTAAINAFLGVGAPAGQTTSASPATSAPSEAASPSAATEIAEPMPTTMRVPLHLPILPAIAATASMAIFGLTIPNSALRYSVSGTGFAIIAGCLAVGGVLVMATFAPLLARPNSAIIDPTTERPA
jgi:hypothetical protein